MARMNRLVLAVWWLLYSVHASALPEGPTLGADECQRKSTYKVTRLEDSTKRGTLRAALDVPRRGEKQQAKKSCRHIKFLTGGTIELKSPIHVRSSRLTVDGCDAPAPGITITQQNNGRKGNGIIIDGTRSYTHDIIFRCIRFKGLHKEDPVHKVGSGLFSIDGDCTPANCRGDWSETDGGVANILLDRVIFAESRDKLTIWGKVSNLLISQSFFYHNTLALLMSFYGSSDDLQRKHLVISNSLFAENNERNPQVRGWTDSLHIQNNIFYHWDAFPPLVAADSAVGDGYGIRLKNEPGEAKINANIINNLFVPSNHPPSAARALIYGWYPGADPKDGGPARCLTQGSYYPDSNMGNLWVSDNELPLQNCDQYSTVTEPLARPTWLVEPTEVKGLCRKLRHEIEPRYPLDVETKILEALEATCSVSSQVKHDAARATWR